MNNRPVNRMHICSLWVSKNIDIGGAQVPILIFFSNCESKIWKGRKGKRKTGILQFSCIYRCSNAILQNHIYVKWILYWIKFHIIITLSSSSTFSLFCPKKTYALTIWKSCCMVIFNFFLNFFVWYTLKSPKHFSNNFVDDSFEVYCREETFPEILTTRIFDWFKTKIHSTNYFSFSIQQIAHIFAIIWMMLFILLVGIYHPLFRFLMVFCYLF